MAYEAPDKKLGSAVLFVLPDLMLTQFTALDRDGIHGRWHAWNGLASPYI